MTDSERTALELLAERKVWAMDELPDGVGQYDLMGLDDLGFIEARGVVMANRQQSPTSPVTYEPQRMHWVSPLAQPRILGSWDKIMLKVERTDLQHPYEIRVTDRGRLEISRSFHRADSTNTDVVGAAAAATEPTGAPIRPQPQRAQQNKRHEWLAKAMLTVRDHPDWPDAQIARESGIHPSQLSRSREYKLAASLARSADAPSGSVTRDTSGNRSVEATDDSLDLNRSASRQSTDEEDLDERIDREMSSDRNVQRNGKQR